MFETVEITDQIRTGLPGKSAALANGTTYYQLDGPQQGQLVVLIHGMSIPSFVWDQTWEPLVAAGFQVLRYDLYGRGHSDRPKVRHNVQLYVRQLLELLHELQLAGEPLNLVGFSLGGAVAAAFASEHAALVRRICLIDPVHPADMPPPPGKTWQKLLRFRILAVSVDQGIINGLPHNFYRYEDFPDFADQVSEGLQYKRSAAAITATLIDFDYTALPAIYAAVGQLPIPSCLIWGQEDRQADLATSAEFLALMPGIQFHVIKQAGHLSHYERPDLVNPLLINFLQT